MLARTLAATGKDLALALALTAAKPGQAEVVCDDQRARNDKHSARAIPEERTVAGFSPNTSQTRSPMGRRPILRSLLKTILYYIEEHTGSVLRSS